MQLFCIQSTPAWLLLPAFAVALSVPIGGSTTGGAGQLNLLIPQNLSSTSLNRLVHCKPEDPYFLDLFTSSRNTTFLSTPNITESFRKSAGLAPDQETQAFYCTIELPGGIVSFDIEGQIESDLTLVVQFWVEVLGFKYNLGITSCNVLDLDKDPCATNFNIRIIKGQAGVFPQQDPDPKYEDLCFEVHATLKLPFHAAKPVDFEKCFYKFPKPDQIGSAQAGGPSSR